jgi:ERF superfamily
MEMSADVTALAAALAKAQAEVQGALKSSENPYYRSTYADLQAVWAACRKPLTDHGLSILQSPSTEPTENGGVRVYVETILLHESGQWIRGIVSVAAKDDSPQAIGSCISYMKRYALQSFAGVAPEDDDDAEAAQATHRRAQATPKAAAAMPPDTLPPGPVGITKVTTQATKNPAVQRHTVHFTDGRLANTINEFVASLAVESQKHGVPVYAKLRESRYGLEIISLTRADREEPEPLPPLTSEDIPF